MAITNPWELVAFGICMGGMLNIIWHALLLKQTGDLTKAGIYAIILCWVVAGLVFVTAAVFL